MGVLTKVRCKAGRHSGEWSHPGRRCEIVRLCDSCGRRDEKTRHVWGRFAYVQAGRCDEIRRCERCGATESRDRHEWGPWLYLNTEMNSPQVHRCRRCHETERSGPTMR